MSKYKQEIIERAKEYYFRHMNLPEEQYSYLWDQCSDDYKECWLELARIEIEEHEEMVDYYMTQEYLNM